MFNLKINKKNIMDFFFGNNLSAEYSLLLEGYYFCKKKQLTIAVIRLRNKRTTIEIPVANIVKNKNFVRELSPIDSCILGVLANSEKNGKPDTAVYNLKDMIRLKSRNSIIKYKPILNIIKKSYDKNDCEIITLYSLIHDKKIEISAIDLLKNYALLYSINSLEALAVGYSASESLLRAKYRV